MSKVIGMTQPNQVPNPTANQMPNVDPAQDAMARATQMFRVQSLVLATSVYNGTGVAPAEVEKCADSFFKYLIGA
jgi:hypothetical protein